MRTFLWIVAALAVAWVVLALAVPMPKPHGDRVARDGAAVRFVEVEPGVRLEILDFGGAGSPIMLLTGLGMSAHGFAGFASALTGRHHVYALTRRGFGASSIPASGYSAKRLGEDVVVVIDALGLSRPVLVGHSIAGEVMSAVAAYHPDKVAGLVYLDAGYGYALDDIRRESLSMRVAPLFRVLEFVLPPPLRRPEFEMFGGQEKFFRLDVPVLAIFADPHGDSKPADDLRTEEQARAFERQVPGARVVRIPHADHAIYNSNRDQVVRETEAFISGLTPMKTGR